MRTHTAGSPSDVYHETTYRVVVDLLVTDLSRTVAFAQFLPFVIDTGSPFTVIPRALLSSSAFQSQPGAVHYTIQDASGHPIVGRRFWVELSIRPQDPTCNPLKFDRVNVFVPDADVRLDWGLLGLDALRQVITVFDQSGVIFRQSIQPLSSPTAG